MGKTCFSLHFCKMWWQGISTKEIASLLLPLYIYLPKYKDKNHFKEGLLEKVLQEAGLSEAERAAILSANLLLILDGFDEVSIDHNLYSTQGWGKRGLNIKMLVTCRAEALVNKNIPALFEASETFTAEPAYFEILYMQPFNDDQIKEYLKEYLDKQRKLGEQCSSYDICKKSQPAQLKGAAIVPCMLF